MKHAYCIMAHTDPYCLETLIGLIDYEGNDVYLHIDRKASPDIGKGLKTEKAGLNIIPFEKLIDVRWGGLSQVKAELLLFETALNTGEYDYIHLISGADLPLKSQKVIHDFFNSQPKGSNFVAFSSGDAIEKNVAFKTQYYHPFVEYQRFRNDGNLLHRIEDFSAKVVRNLTVKTQKLISAKRNWNDLEIKKGSQWVSISSDFARYLVDRKNYILRRFRGVICPDEIFLQTMLYNSPFASTVVKDNLRKIDWERGTPYTWRQEDFPEIINSDALFARKFSSVTDSKIISLIKEANKSVNKDQ